MLLLQPPIHRAPYPENAVAYRQENATTYSQLLHNPQFKLTGKAVKWNRKCRWPRCAKFTPCQTQFKDDRNKKEQIKPNCKCMPKELPYKNSSKSLPPSCFTQFQPEGTVILVQCPNGFHDCKQIIDQQYQQSPLCVYLLQYRHEKILT